MKKHFTGISPLYFSHTRWFITFLFVVILIFPAYTVEKKDFRQLENEIKNMPDDTARANRLISLGKHYCSTDNDKALMYLQEAYSISVKEKYVLGTGKSLMWQGRVYYYKDNYAVSNKYFNRAKMVLEPLNDNKALSFLYYARAVNDRITGDYVNAIRGFQKAILLSEKVGNIKRASICYNNIGIILIDRGESRKAQKYLFKALKMEQSINDKPGMSNVFTGIATSYKNLGELDSALFYYRQALNIRAGLNMGSRMIASSEYNIGSTLIDLGKYREAEKILTDAHEKFMGLEEKTGVIITELKIAVAKSKLNEPGAVETADKALKLAKSIDNLNLVSYTYKVLSTIYSNSGHYHLAYNYLKMHKYIDDSLFTSQKERVLTEMEAKFQSDKKDSEIRFLTSKNKIQRKNNILLIVLVFVFIAGIILLFFLFRLKSTALQRQKKLHEQENIINRQETQIVAQEKKLLQEQLESKNRELASKALEMIRLNETITEIIEKLEEFKRLADVSPEIVKNTREIIHDLETHTKQNIWNEFDKIFRNIHSGFYARLFEISSNLSSSEIKIAALLKLNLTTKEIAAITFKSEGGIKTTRYRLRKKLGLSGDDSLVPFLMQI